MVLETRELSLKMSESSRLRNLVHHVATPTAAVHSAEISHDDISPDGVPSPELPFPLFGPEAVVDDDFVQRFVVALDCCYAGPLRRTFVNLPPPPALAARRRTCVGGDIYPPLLAVPQQVCDRRICGLRS